MCLFENVYVKLFFLFILLLLSIIKEFYVWNLRVIRYFYLFSYDLNNDRFLCKVVELICMYVFYLKLFINIELCIINWYICELR